MQQKATDEEELKKSLHIEKDAKDQQDQLRINSRSTQDAAGWSWMVLNGDGCCWMLLDGPEWCWMLLDAAEWSWMVLDVTGCC